MAHLSYLTHGEHLSPAMLVGVGGKNNAVVELTPG